MSPDHAAAADTRRACERIPDHVDTFLFDLDGTLVDSAPRIRRTLRATLEDCLGIRLSEEEIASHTGVPLWHIMACYDPDRIDELVEYYRCYYAEIGPTPPCEGIVPVLSLLLERGCALAVVTTKGRDSAEAHLDEAGLTGFFPVVVTWDEVSEPKPAKEPVMRALDGLGSSPARAIMIGDAPADILSGNAAGTLTAWAMWGTDHKPDFGAVEPDYCWEDPSALMRAIR